MKHVCAVLAEQKAVKITTNNITNKFRRKTIKFEGVQDIVNALGYHIEFIKD